MDLKRKEMDFKMQLLNEGFEEVSSASLELLKGGFARILSSEKEKSKEGDGAEYVCCIEINFPKK